ncbi:MAG: hypothetical protein ACR2KQ_06300 [Actinomycetota bacterium]
MPSDIGSRLEAASAGPSQPLDVATVWKTARRRKLIARAVTSAALVVAISAPAGILKVGGNQNRPVAPADAEREPSPPERSDTILICNSTKGQTSTSSSPNKAGVECTPYDMSFARYQVVVPRQDAASANDEVVSGMVELSPEYGSACLTLSGLSFSQASLTNERTVITFSSANAKGGNICVNAISRDLGFINGSFDSFHLEVRLDDGSLVKVPLQYLDQSGDTHQGQEVPTEWGYSPPRFARLEGWFSSSSGKMTDGRSPSAWAATLDLGGRFSYSELPQMNPADIVIYAQLVTPADYVNYPLKQFPRRDLPLDLEDAEIHESFSGQWDEEIPERLLRAHVGGHRLIVWTWFGTAKPDASMLDRAQEQLTRLRLPEPWKG